MVMVLGEEDLAQSEVYFKILQKKKIDIKHNLP